MVCDILIQKFMSIIQRKSTEIMMIYGDQDGMYKEETQINVGQRFVSQRQADRIVSYI